MRKIRVMVQCEFEPKEFDSIREQIIESVRDHVMCGDYDLEIIDDSKMKVVFP